MTTVFRPADVDPADLEAKPLAPPSATPLSGEIVVRSRVAFANDERTIISGIWESDPGVSRWEFETRGEIVHILSGSLTVQEDGAETIELTAGSAAVFPIGWKGVWTVTDHVRKLYVVYK